MTMKRIHIIIIITKMYNVYQTQNLNIKTGMLAAVRYNAREASYQIGTQVI